MVDVNVNELKFSVSMCTYGKDNPEWLKRAVDSILNQTVKPNEVVLVVDGPVPTELDAVILEYEKMPVFKVVRLEENQGLGNALRVAIDNSSYDLIARMDSDDVSVENRFEQQLKCFVLDNDLDVVGGNITEFVGEESNIVSIREVPENDVDIKKYLKKRCPFNHMTVMFKKQSVLDVDNYLDWFYNEDYYLWLRMFLNNKVFMNTGTILVNMRTGEDMYRRRGGFKYFKSEAKLQKFMLKNKIIGLGTYLVNVTKRFIVEVLLPNKIRGWAFKKFARKSVK